MSSVDDRIVNMQFNNKQFVQGAAESEKALSGIERTLARVGKNKGLNELDKNVQSASQGFSALQVIGVTALAKLTTSAMDFGKSLMGKAFGPITEGGMTRALNIEQAKFQFAGLGMDIEKSMESALTAVKGTAYGLDVAAKLASQFGASGMEAGQEMTDALRGVAGAAAMTNTSFEEIGHIFKSIAGEGKVSAIRMEQFGTRGLNAWSSLAKAMGKSEVEIRAMVKNREIDFKTFAAAMNDAFGEHATAANKTYTGSLSNMRAALSRIGASFAAAKIENQRRVFNKLTPVIDNVHDALAPLIKSYEMWQNVGRRNMVRFLTPLGDPDNNPFMKYSQSIENVSRTFVVLRKIVSMITGDISSAFSEVFDGSGGAFLAFFEKVTGSVRRFFTGIKDGLRDGEGVKPFFVGIFSILKVGFTIIGALGSAFGSLFSGLSKGAGVATGGLNDFITAIAYGIKGFADWINEGGRLTRIFSEIGSSIGAFVSPLVQGLGLVTKAVASLVGGGGVEGFLATFQLAKGSFADFASTVLGEISRISSPFGRLSELFDGLREKVESFKKALTSSGPGSTSGVDTMAASAENSLNAWSAFEKVIRGVVAGVGALFYGLGKTVSWVAGQFKDLFGNYDALEWGAVLNTVLSGALLLSVRSFVKKLGGLLEGFSGLGESVTGTFDQLTSTLKTMQTGVKVDIIRNIAIAVGVLTASIIALSFIKPEKIAVSIGAIASMLGVMVGAIAALVKIGKGMEKAGIGLVSLAGAMVLMAGAMITLSAAVAILGRQDLATLAKGLGAVAIATGIMVRALDSMSFMNTKGLFGASAAMIAIAGAMVVLSAAVLAFGKMKLGTLAKGLGSIAIALAIFTKALTAMGRISKGSVAKSAASIVLLSVAMNMLATAVFAFGKMDFGTLAKGFGSIAVGLLAMVVALMFLSGVSAGALMAAGAMVLMAGALNLLVPVILTLGTVPWEVVARGIGFMAAALGVLLLGAAIAALPPVTAGLIVLGAVIAALGASMFLAGVGMTAFAAGFAIVVAAGSAGVAIITSAFSAFIAMLPTIGAQLAAAFVAFLEVLAQASPKVRRALGEIIRNLLGVLRDNIPVFKDTFVEFIGAGIDAIVQSVDLFVEGALTLINSFLRRFSENIPELATNATNFVIAIMTAIGENTGPIMDAALKMIADFLGGIADAIDANKDNLREQGARAAYQFSDGMSGGLVGYGVKEVTKAVVKLGSAAKRGLDSVLQIFSPSRVAYRQGAYYAMGFANGISGGVKRAVNAAAKMANAVIAQGEKSVLKVQQMAAKAQRVADRAEANAELADRKARRSQREANRLQREADKAADKNAKNQKKLQKQANEAQRRADALASTADKKRDLADRKQARADAAAQKVLWQKEFQQADSWTRGEMRDERAVQFAADAQAMLAKANANAAEIKRLAKSKDAADKKAAKALRKENQKVIKEARKLAKAAQNARNQAIEEYGKAITASVTSIRAEQEAYDKARRDEAELEAAEKPDEKAEILERRSAANEKAAEDARKKGEAALKAAERLAKSDAIAAAKQLEIAEEQLALSRELNDQARSERTQAKQLRDQAKNQVGSEGTNANITPSKAVLEEAAKTIDRYTESLRQAQEAAETSAPVVQFVQHNSSPEALTAAEIYRQTKNLLSTQEIKMGAK